MRAFLDAAALVALLRDEPAAGRVAEALRVGEAAITAINLGETIDVVVRRGGVAPTDARRVIGRLTAGALAVIPVDEATAWRAAELRARRYHRSLAPLSLSDCVCLVAASEIQGTVLTSDGPMLHVARAEGIAAEALPDSGGRMPPGA